MKKKIVLAGCIMAMAMVFTGCGKKTESTTFIMSDVQEGDHPTAKACDEFAKRVYRETDGRVNIEVYHGDTLGAEADQMEQVRVDGIDFARLSGPLSNYVEDMKAFQSLYLYNSEDDMWKVLDGSVGNDLLNAKGLTDNDMVGLCWFSGGSRNFYNNKKEVKSPSDLYGLTLRVNTDPMIKLVSMNGGTPVNIAYNDIYNAIKKGTIDGAENNWPSYISTEHYKVAKYITVDQHTCIPEMIVASQKALEKMSSQDQETVKNVAKEISKEQRQAFKDFDKKAIKQAEKAGCKVTELTESESAEFKKQGQEVNKEVNGQYQDVIDRITQ